MQGDGKVIRVRKIAKGGNYTVTKSNALNEMRRSGFRLQELRFLCIYLGLINPGDPETRTVGISLEDFREVMDLHKVDLSDVKAATDALLSKPVSFKLPGGGYVSFPLFDGARVDKDENGDWAVEISAHEKAMPLFFRLKENWHYFKYGMWNALRLKSFNQVRMYELLKQYEARGWRDVGLQELRELLEIGPGEYTRYSDFKTRVLDACQEALAKHTDIVYTYEPVGKKGPGGKVRALRFRIAKNPAHECQLRLDDFLPMEDLIAIAGDGPPPESPALEPPAPPAPEWLPAYRAATENRLPERQLASLRALMQAARPELRAAGTEAEAAHLAYWYDYALGKEKAGAIEKTFYAYLKKVAAQPVHGSAADMENKQKTADAKAARPRKNAFMNFNQREYDWAALEKMERAHIDKKHGFTYEGGKLRVDGAAAAADPR